MADLSNDTSLKIALDEIEKKVIQAETDRNNLETILGTKDVEIVPGSKMSSLIGKVNSIEKCDIVKTEDTNFFVSLRSTSSKHMCKTSFNTLGLINFGKADLVNIGGGFDGVKPRLFSVSSSMTSLHEIDIDTFTIINTTDISSMKFYCIGVGFDGVKSRYFIGYGSSKSGLSEIDIETLTIIKNFSLNGITFIKSINFINDEDSNKLYTYNNNGAFIEEYNVETYSYLKGTRISNTNTAFAIGSRNGKKKAFEVESNVNIYEVEPQTYTKLEWIPLGFRNIDMIYMTSASSYIDALKYKNNIYIKLEGE